MIIFSASPADEESIRLAKEWIHENGLTKDDVRLIKNEHCVYVERKQNGR